MKNVLWLMFGHPLWLLAPSAAAAWLARRPLGRSTALSRLLPVLCRVFLYGLVALAVAYLFYDRYVDQIEAGIISASWAIEKGRPVYHALTDPGRYAYIYGPLLFILNFVTMKIVGPSMLSSKLAGVLCGLTALGILASHARKVFPLATERLLYLGTLSLTLLCFGPVAYYTRADAPLLLCLAFALHRADRPTLRLLDGVLLGIALGAAVNIKPHAALYFIPIGWLCLIRGGIRTCGASLLAAAFVAVTPYFLFETVTWKGYSTLLLAATRQGPKPDPMLVFQNLEWLAVLLLPLVLLLPAALPRLGHALRNPLRLDDFTGYSIAFVSSCLGVAFIAGRPSASVSHLLPLFALAAPLARRLLDRLRGDDRTSRTIRGVLPAYYLTLAFVAGWMHLYFAQFILKTWHPDEKQDLRAVIDSLQGKTLAYAFGGTDYFQLATGMNRTWIDFAPGGFNRLDLPAMSEFHLSRVPTPEATRKRMLDCEVDAWISSKGVAPFAGSEIYDGLDVQFNQAYVKTRSSRYFDVWQCASKPRT